jgi:hypothetical protein
LRRADRSFATAASDDGSRAKIELIINMKTAKALVDWGNG